jgi:DNA-binding CsgD family transcriptional regulator
VLNPIIERLYDAVLDADLWPSALEYVADAFGGAGSALLSNTKATGLWVRVDPAARSLFEKRFLSCNPVHAYVMRARQSPHYRPAVSTDRDIAMIFDLGRTAYYNEFLRPFDGVNSLAMDLGVRGMTAALNISRTAKQGPFEATQIATANILHPHITRAFWLSVKLAEKARFGDGILQGLEHATFGVLLLDSDGQIAYANKMADSILRERNGLRSEGRNLCALRSDSTAALQKLIAGAIAPNGGKTGGSCSIPRPSRLPLSVTVTPLRNDRAALFEANPSAIVCVFDPTSPFSFSTEHLREMFGLSPAEARVALKLLGGLDQKEIAAALGISFFTVRAHLSQIYQKTNTNRQVEFVGLVLRSINSVLFGHVQ